MIVPAVSGDDPPTATHDRTTTTEQVPMTSRPTASRRVLAAAATAALVVGFAACGDDDDSAGGDFCDQAREMDESFQDLDMTEADFGEIASTMASIEAPGEIADDWDTMAEGFERLQDVDLSDPDSIDEADFDDADEASDRVVEYLAAECDIDA